jgi:CO/xanthine dehydrogenase Mo-binding subunit
MASGKPVKMVLTREEDFIAGRPLLSEDLTLKMGFKKDGTLVAKKLDIIANAGAYTGSSRGVTSVSASRPDNMYRCPHIATTANLVYTNTVPRGSLRGYGTQILNFALESMMDMAAEELGLGRTQIRHRNAVEKGETTVHGMILNSCAFRETIDLAAGKSDLRQKRIPKNGKAYGIGFGCAMHVAGNRNVVPLFDGSSALVTVDKTGKVRIISGELDIGQGSDTVFVQITAEALGARIEDIKVVPVDTETSPFALGTFGDRVTVLGGAAVRLAATRVKEQLIAFTAEALEANPEDLDLKESQFFVKGMPKPVATLPEMALKATFKRGGLPVMGQGDYTVPEWVGFTDNKTQYGNYSIAYTFITQVAEVAVDLQTGVADVTNVWCAVDLGKVFNPKASEGQVEGGVMMGIGYALTEDYVLENGVMQNPNFHDYKVPSFSNLPKINSYFIEEPDPNTPFGAKSIGEAIGDPTAAAVANAIYDAVGVRVKDLPITPEKILRALREKETSP